MGSPLAYEREGLDIRHIRELFGNPDLTRLKSDDVRAAYAKARKEGRFSESEIRRIHIKLKQVMEDAVDNDLVGKNPCRGVKLPKQNVEVRKALSADEAARLLAVLLEEKPSSFITCTMLLLLCGLRKGEALGLSWEDYDPDAKTLRIVKQYTNDRTLRPPKSKMSRRKISVGNELADYLDRWKAIQRSEFDSFAVGQTGETPIVHSIGVVDAANGKRALVTRMDGHNYSRAFRLFAAKNGFGTFEESREVLGSDGVKRTRYTGYSGLKPHELRHTQATLLVGANADIKTIQARLGHASPSTTLSIYSHFIEANDQKAASVLDNLLKG
ncbi:MAG: site-specific integrase [Collinsella sp.]|nr:site-specific integrase [Collinsella sp.]